jgi:glycosyltransferase involved in cell wall biosynthesis
MTILILNQHLQDVIGGSEIQCDLIAKGLMQRGHEVVYLAINGRQTVYHAPYRVHAGTLAWKTMKRLIAEFQPDVAYWRFNKRHFLFTMLLLKCLRVRVVFAISHQNDVSIWAHKVRQHGATWREKLARLRMIWRPALASRINHLGYRFVAGVVAQLYQQTGKLPVKREVVIANSVDGSAAPFAWEKPFVLWAASVKASKNPEQFLELARSLQDLRVDFLMVGDIVHRSYRDLIMPAEALPNFHYLGVKTYRELNGMLRQARLLAHTCEPEGFPNIMIQAWMQGTPTVSLYYDPDRIIERNQLGSCSGTFEKFQQDVRTLLANAALREEIGQRAMRFAQEHFNVDENIRQLETFLFEISSSR